ncbi:MAG: hypothetical protein ACE5FS_04305 [Paracoccaceae bacterium]
MRSFLLAMLAIVVISFVAYEVLGYLDFSSAELHRSADVRLDR